MANFFIAVGGTGQMAALSYLKLSGLCGFKLAGIYLMDCDITGPITNDLKRILHTENIPTIKPIPNDGHLGSFVDIFANPIFDNYTQPILSLLFTEDEWKVAINQGMYGRPPVGASALMSKKVQIAVNPAADPDLAALLNFVNVGQNRVTICGSMIGGTGAGGVPTLAQHIRNNAVGGNITTIIDFIKWFILQSADNVPVDLTTMEDRRLQINSESGVFYLKDKIADNVDACVLLGLPNPVLVDYKKVGQQIEIPHFLNLIAAITANNSFNVNNYLGIFPNPNSFYGYVVPDGGVRPAGLNVLMPDQTGVTLDKIIMMAKAVSRFLGYFNKYIDGYPNGFFGFTPFLNVPDKIRKAISCLAQSNNQSEEGTCKVIIAEIGRRKIEYESWLTWFYALRSPGIFEFNDDEITITTKKYKRAENHPLLFLRKWFNELNIDNWLGGINHNNPADKNMKIFVDEMIKGLRRSINRSFLNGCFGNMNWLN